ncbi:MAG: FHA domain-containing protein [Pyrinomonadaceae bacterium]|nr:FHA domain-containing protein [Pyrinomonadaceae bacterium]
MRYTLHIEGPYDSRSIEVGDSISIGRTELANVVIDDSGLSRVNTTFFIDDGELLVADENSTNGTFLNGERIEGRPRILRDGDRLKIGSNTTIRVEAVSENSGYPSSAPQAAAPVRQEPAAAIVTATPAYKPQQPNATQDKLPLVVIAAGIMTVVILLFGGIAYVVVSQMDSGTPGPKGNQATASALIPVRVIDPLGGENEEELDDLIASWEVAEEEINASDVADIKVESPEAEAAELNVSATFLADRQRLALADRPGETGIRPAGLQVPKELYGDGVIKQKQKLAQMKAEGYQQPMDFADLAAKRLSGDLIEMPMAAQSFYLDVGGSAQDKVFSSYSFSQGAADIVPGHPKFDTLKRLADNFAGQKYDLNLPEHRKQIRRRLLRMFQSPAKPILKELADAYFARFQRPLRVTSLTRSMDYQILLNSNNANSFKVKGEGSLPPHTSGCAFDLARKHMPVEEQNFVMAKLAEMERAGKLDALIEYGVNACFHVFIYRDGRPPTASNFSSYDYETFPFLAGIRLNSDH